MPMCGTTKRHLGTPMNPICQARNTSGWACEETTIQGHAGAGAARSTIRAMEGLAES
jgi:hypothetical protein